MREFSILTCNIIPSCRSSFLFFSGNRRKGSAAFTKGQSEAIRRRAVSCLVKWDMRRGECLFAVSLSFRVARENGDKRRRLIPLIGTRASFASEVTGGAYTCHLFAQYAGLRKIFVSFHFFSLQRHSYFCPFELCCLFLQEYNTRISYKFSILKGLLAFCCLTQ